MQHPQVQLACRSAHLPEELHKCAVKETAGSQVNVMHCSAEHCNLLYSAHPKKSTQEVGMQSVAGRLRPSTATGAHAAAATGVATWRAARRRGAAWSCRARWDVCRDAQRRAGLGGASRAAATANIFRCLSGDAKQCLQGAGQQVINACRSRKMLWRECRRNHTSSAGHSAGAGCKRL